MPKKTDPQASPAVAVKKNYLFPPATISALERLRTTTDCSTETDVVKRAINLYALIVEHGGRYTVKDKDGQPVMHVA